MEYEKREKNPEFNYLVNQQKNLSILISFRAHLPRTPPRLHSKQSSSSQFLCIPRTSIYIKDIVLAINVIKLRTQLF